MVGKMAVGVVALVLALAALGWYSLGQRKALMELGALVVTAQADAKAAHERANAEVKRASRVAARAEASRRAAEADLSRALAQLRQAAKEPAAKAWLLQPLPPGIKEALQGCKADEGKECP